MTFYDAVKAGHVEKDHLHKFVRKARGEGLLLVKRRTVGVFCTILFDSDAKERKRIKKIGDGYYTVRRQIGFLFDRKWSIADIIAFSREFLIWGWLMGMQIAKDFVMKNGKVFFLSGN